MRKLAVAALVLLALAASAAALSPVQERLHWRRTVRADTPEGYRAYLDGRPGGRRAAEATRRLDEVSWQRAVLTDTPESFTEYLRALPAGAYADRAKLGIERHAWRAASAADTIVAYDVYLGEYPEGKFAADARQRQQALVTDDAPFLALEQTGTADDYWRFLAEYPGHARSSDVDAALRDMDGRDIVDLLREGKVEARPSGSGIEHVSVELRRSVPHEIKVRIPAGTFFGSRDGSVQSMVATSATEVVLSGDAWTSIAVDAACADMPLAIPSVDDTFQIQRAPRDRDLQRLAKVLERTRPPFAVRQAAVWILTDDADFNALGTLVRRSVFTPFGGTRMIDEMSAVWAMHLLVEAGVDLTDFAITWDGEWLADELPDGEHKSWLRQWLNGRAPGR